MLTFGFVYPNQINPDFGQSLQTVKSTLIQH